MSQEAEGILLLLFKGWTETNEGLFSPDMKQGTGPTFGPTFVAVALFPGRAARVHTAA